MKHLLLLCLLLPCAAALSQPDPVTNGGFEVLDAQGFPADWGAVGRKVSVTTEAHSGQYALRFERGSGPDAGPETGLNRGWTPESGSRGRMLAETRGGIIFWYRLLAADPRAEVSFQVIPMNAQAWEDTGSPRTIRRISAETAGDGKWHEGRLTYDYSASPKVRWVHVGVRLTGGSATLLLDDVRWIERAGPILQIEKVHVYPDARHPDRAARLTACVTNLGDTTSGPVTLSLNLPAGMRAPAAVPTVPLSPGGAATRIWTLSGPMQPGALRLRSTDGSARDEFTLPLAARITVQTALAQPGLAPTGGEAVVTATLWNRGTALSGAQASLTTRGGARLLTAARVVLPAIAPGRNATARWRVRLPHIVGVYTLACRVTSPGTLAMRYPTVTVTDALSKPAVPVAGLLRMRRGTDRTLGEVITPGPTGGICARLPHLGKVIARLPDGSTQTLYARYGSVRRNQRAGGMTAVERDRAGGVWTFHAIAAPVTATATRLSLQVQCSAPRVALAFEGPMLLAGEGATGAAKREAVFPGLEWLTAGEVSSSDLDIAPDHPDRFRITPHPHKVTIPFMAVHTPRAVVGLLWDVHSRWDGQHVMPQPVFASPDFLEGAGAHRMGLMAPNVPAGLPENARRANPGYRLSAGRPLTLTATLYADPTARDALAAMDAWFRLYHPDPVLPAPQGSDRAQVAWSMRAYMQTLWLSAVEGWMPFQGGPAIWRKPVFDRSFAFDLMQAAALLPDHPEAARWRERLAEVMPHIGCPQGDDLGFAGGDVLAQFGGVAARAYQLMPSQQADGSWRYDADKRDEGVNKGMDYHLLGPDDAAESGIIARNAYEVLLYARISGDKAAYALGLKALEYMRRYLVPRAAQVWEVPVHTPDILAAADAVEAYLEAYRYTQRDGRPGDSRWLREARRWARAGLPFVYVWNAPGKPWMRYGSIPVFGATWFQGSWFGNLVQWNGLRHGFALLKLYEYDPKTRMGGLTWRDITLGLTRSAMYQQSTDEKNLGLWPDSFHTITSVRAQWDFAPRIFLKNVFTLLGRGEEPRTRALTIIGGVARVTALGRIEQAQVAGNRLRLRLRRPAGLEGRLMVAGITRPAEVRVNGQPLTERATGAAADGGWQFDATRGLLAVPAAGETVVVEITGLRTAPARGAMQIADRLAFDFSAGAQGWVSTSDLTLPAVEDGTLRVTVTGRDPYLHRYLCRIPGSSVREIVLRARTTGDAGWQLFWTTRAQPDWNEEKSVRFDLPADGQWHEVRIPVGDHPGWRGQIISGLRLDPGSTPGSEAAIAWIHGQ